MYNLIKDVILSARYDNTLVRVDLITQFIGL